MSPVHVDVKDHVAVVTLDYPPVNALSGDAYERITEVFDGLHNHEEARVVVLTAAGDRAFCAGADIKARAAAAVSDAKTDHGRAVREAFNAIYDCPLPVIGAVNGPALGAGVSVAASCDYLIASEKAVFGLPEIDVGLMGGARHLARLFPQTVVRRMLFTAERIGAEEAHRLGGVVRVVPHERLMDEAMSDASIIAAKMPLASRLAKEALNQIEWMDLKNGYRFEQTRTEILQKTEDALEAKRAFLEKRPPQFKGR
jgi:enoyl-CoA hydratase